MDIYSLLPLLEGWRWEPRDISFIGAPQPILPGRVFEIVRLDLRKGWITGASVTLDNPHVLFVLGYDHISITGVSPDEAFSQGLTQPQNTGFWMPTYDTTVTPNVFTLVFSPSAPIPFHRRVDGFLRNPAVRPDRTANSTAFIYNYTLSTVEIDDEELFIASIKRIICVDPVIPLPPPDVPPRPPVEPPDIPPRPPVRPPDVPPRPLGVLPVTPNLSPQRISR